MSLWKALVLMLAGVMFAGLLAACGTAAPTPTPTQAVEGDAPVPTPTQVVAGVPTVAPAAATVAASATTTTAVKPEPGGIWNVAPGTGSPPRSVDPYHIAGLANYNVFNGLVQPKLPLDPSKGIEYEPYLATEYSQSEDGSKWRFKLRQGVTFHDGEVFNADDVVATVQRMLDPQSPVSPRQAQTRKIFTGVKKIEDYTVELDTGVADATAFSWIANYLMVMTPEHLIKGDPTATDVTRRWKFMGPKPEETGTLAVGTGPFKMTKFQVDVETIGERFPNYFKFDQYGNRLPYLDKFVESQVTDPLRRVALFVAGRAAWSLGTGSGLRPDHAVQLCKQTKDSKCYTLPLVHGFFSVATNSVSTEVFKDGRVKTAARYSQDNDGMFKEAFGGRLGYLWMDRDNYPDTTLTVKEQYELLPWSDPVRRAEFVQKAKDLLTGAGYPNGIDLPYPTYGSTALSGCTGSQLDLSSRIVDQAYRVGFRSSLECRLGVDKLAELTAGRWSIALPPAAIQRIDPTFSVSSHALLDSTVLGGTATWSWPGQVELDALFRKATKTTDQAKRNELYKGIERYMANPALNIFPSGYSSVQMVVHGCVHGYRPGGLFQSHQWFEGAWLTGECRN